MCGKALYRGSESVPVVPAKDDDMIASRDCQSAAHDRRSEQPREMGAILEGLGAIRF